MIRSRLDTILLLLMLDSYYFLRGKSSNVMSVIRLLSLFIVIIYVAVTLVEKPEPLKCQSEYVVLFLFIDLILQRKPSCLFQSVQLNTESIWILMFMMFMASSCETQDICSWHDVNKNINVIINRNISFIILAPKLNCYSCLSIIFNIFKF